LANSQQQRTRISNAKILPEQTTPILNVLIAMFSMTEAVHDWDKNEAKQHRPGQALPTESRSGVVEEHKKRELHDNRCIEIGDDCGRKNDVDHLESRSSTTTTTKSKMRVSPNNRTWFCLWFTILRIGIV
jgi:hypothetical protein